MTPEQTQTLATLLRAKREALGLSANEVAKQAGINVSSVWRIEEGQRANPKADVLQAIGSVLGITTSDLFAAAGWVPKRELPTFRPYMRTKYNLSPRAMRELETKLDEWARDQGIDFDKDTGGPMNGEDEAPPIAPAARNNDKRRTTP